VDRRRPPRLPIRQVPGSEFRVPSQEPPFVILQLGTWHLEPGTFSDSGIMRGGSPLTVAGPCWLCSAACRGGALQLPLHPGAPSSTCARRCALLPRHLLSNPPSPGCPDDLRARPVRGANRLPTGGHRATKNPNLPRKIGVPIPKPNAKPDRDHKRSRRGRPSPRKAFSTSGLGRSPGLRLTLLSAPSHPI
jgi:hypothetical protein